LRRIEMENTFTGVFQKVNDWYIGYVEELTGANSQGRTLEEVRENLQEAVELILQANRELAEKELVGKDVIREEIKVRVA
jgi:predicted RNase H-like HicB family nuclease